MGQRASERAADQEAGVSERKKQIWLRADQVELTVRCLKFVLREIAGAGTVLSDAYKQSRMIRLAYRWFWCSWRGHREKRVISPAIKQALREGARREDLPMETHNRICTRCGARRLARQRPRKVSA